MGSKRTYAPRGVALLCGIGLAVGGGCASGARSAPPVPPDAGADRVPVGYGTLPRRHVTGSVGSVVVSRAEATRVARVEELMEGRIPGVDVQRLPGGDFAVRVRGGATVLDGGDPLYVVDGMPLMAGVPPRLLLAGIDPADVVRIDVLRDGGSAAIYGLRGANGVVLITTRHDHP
ncbi:MAG TPA: TonB-dependent receptor plug domain-containing protein [Longimicrobiales bacterium]|nr:TonB-dependent receptor plug domain-containing protein [Longimicrobiales bacterium]